MSKMYAGLTSNSPCSHAAGAVAISPQGDASPVRCWQNLHSLQHIKGQTAHNMNEHIDSGKQRGPKKQKECHFFADMAMVGRYVSPCLHPRMLTRVDMVCKDSGDLPIGR